MSATILVVEDDDHLRGGIRDILEIDGYEVILAADGVEGFEIAQAARPDLIVSDGMMPNMDGFELLAKIRQESQIMATPFIFLTSKGEKVDHHRGIRLGSDYYLTKPFEAEDLLVVVANVLKRYTQIRGPKAQSQHDVFISYSRKDAVMTGKVAHQLKEAGLSIWLDTDELEVGTPSWMMAVQEAIDHSGCVLAVLSPSAKNSKWVTTELHYALNQNKTVYPVIVRGSSQESLPLVLALAQWKDIQEDYVAGIQSVSQTIKKHLNQS